MPRIAVLHPVEMGSAVGAALMDVGADVCWLPTGRSAATRVRAQEARIRPVDDLAGVDLVVSICPPAHALDVARSVAGFTGLFVDANAVSPSTAAQVEQVVTGGGASYVDGGIIGPPPRERGTTRLYLSGHRADEVGRVFHEALIEPVVLDAGPIAASATKMTYAAWSKISAALLLSALETARALDVDDVLRAEWEISQPELAARLESARRSATAKGWRWEAEMQEVARTFADAGQPDGFGAAAAQVFAAYRRPSTQDRA